MFHVSLLKKHVGTIPVTAGNLPECNNDDMVVLKPERILQGRQITRGNSAVPQWLIKWEGLDDSEASWEDASFVVQQFPEFKA